MADVPSLVARFWNELGDAEYTIGRVVPPVGMNFKQFQIFENNLAQALGELKVANRTFTSIEHYQDIAQRLQPDALKILKDKLQATTTKYDDACTDICQYAQSPMSYRTDSRTQPT